MNTYFRFEMIQRAVTSFYQFIYREVLKFGSLGLWRHSDAIKSFQWSSDIFGDSPRPVGRRSVKVVSSWPSRQRESNDMQHDLLDIDRDLDLGSREVKVKFWPLEVIMDIIEIVLTREVQRYQIHRCTSIRSKYISKKYLWLVWRSICVMCVITLWCVWWCDFSLLIF